MYIILIYHFNISLLCNKLDLPSLLVFNWLGLWTVRGSVKALPKSVLRQPGSVGTSLVVTQVNRC